MIEKKRLDANDVFDLFAELWGYRKFFLIVVIVSLCLGLSVATINEKKYKVTASVKVLDLNVSAVIDGLIYDQPYVTVNGNKYHPLMKVNPIDYFRMKKNLIEFVENLQLKDNYVSDIHFQEASISLIDTMNVSVISRDVAVDRGFETVALVLSVYTVSESVSAKLVNEYINYVSKKFKEDLRGLVSEYLIEEANYVNRQIHLLTKNAERNKEAKIEYLKSHAKLAKKLGFIKSSKEIDDINLACLVGVFSCDPSLPLYELGHDLIQDQLEQLMNRNESKLSSDILVMKQRRDYLGSITPDILNKLELVKVLEPAYQAGNPSTPNYFLILLAFCFFGFFLALIVVRQMIKK